MSGSQLGRLLVEGQKQKDVRGVQAQSLLLRAVDSWCFSSQLAESAEPKLLQNPE